MSTVETRRPKVNITCPLGEVSCDELVINAAIRAHTTATFTAYTGNEASSSATRILSTEVATKMGIAQTIGFSNRTDPDTFITVDDGTGNEVTFNMFLTSPTFLMNTASVRPGFGAVAASALMGNLKMDIYTTNTARSNGNKGELGGSTLAVEDEPKAQNLARRLRELTEAVIKNWNRYGKGTSAAAKLKEQRHQINAEGPLDSWYELLSNSEQSLESTATWMSILTRDGTDAVNRDFNTELLSVLRGTTRDFQEVIDTLCAMFQLIMIPDITGAPGKLAVMPELLTAAPGTLVLPANSMLLNGDASHDLLPVQQVLVRGEPIFATLVTRDPALLSTDGGTYYIGGFPDEAPSATGDVPIVTLPSYLRDTVVRVPQSLGNLPPDINSIDSNYSSIKQLTTEFSNEIAKNLVKDFCKGVYVDMALGGTSTSISMPADLSLWPGKRYKVVNSAGGEIFTGFLAGVTHTFKKSVNAGGQATTVCNFSHILFPGFKLRGL